MQDSGADADSGVHGAIARRGVRVCVVQSAAPAYAQHETASDIEDGGRVFRSSCANCHGPDGDEIPGIDLGRGAVQARADRRGSGRASSATACPARRCRPTNMSEEQAAQRRRLPAFGGGVEAQRDRGRATRRAARRSSTARAAVRSCHRVGGVGSRVGPDLTRIGQLRRAAGARASLLDPEAEVLPTNRFYRVVTRDGAHGHRAAAQPSTRFTVQLLDTKEQLRSFVKTRSARARLRRRRRCRRTKATLSRRNSPTSSAIWCR